ASPGAERPRSASTEVRPSASQTLESGKPDARLHGRMDVWTHERTNARTHGNDALDRGRISPHPHVRDTQKKGPHARARAEAEGEPAPTLSRQRNTSELVAEPEQELASRVGVGDR